MTAADRVKIDGEILQKALVLMRDKYHLATEANVFLETNAGVSGISIGIANQRDAITHLVSLLQSPEGDRDAQVTQLANLEEHLRRALMEPYEAAVNLAIVAVERIIEKYKSTVLMLPNQSTLLPCAPTLENLYTAIAAVAERRADGRMSKTENKMTPKWEEGVKDFIWAFNELRRIQTQLEGYIFQAEQAWSNRRSRRRAWLLWILGLIIGLILKIIWDQVSVSR